jgi:uncharacterized DUF497 family protein
VKFEWGVAKRRHNLHRHGIDFVDVPQIFDGDTLSIEDTQLDYGETRYITLGLLRTHVIVVVHTDRKDAIRIISARKATKYEEKTYFEHLAN